MPHSLDPTCNGIDSEEKDAKGSPSDLTIMLPGKTTTYIIFNHAKGEVHIPHAGKLSSHNVANLRLLNSLALPNSEKVLATDPLPKDNLI